jgi:GH15 family glucan-1,4-alpha-glucosidase
MSSTRRIEDYALLGDLQSAALVNRNGSIDWCCLPRFDSGAFFASLLGDPSNGRWLLAPDTEIHRVERRYRFQTLILETTFEADEGTVRVIDFMPPRGEAPDIVRIVEGISGRVPMRSELIVRFGYGRVVPWVRHVGDARLATAGPDALSFRTPVEVRGENLTSVSEFTVAPGHRVPFVLTWYPSHEPPPEPVDAELALEETETYWREWTASRKGDGQEYSEAVQRSLLVLKALTYDPTGGIVAAPTTSLPEQIGGVRNWDYRYCWLRDASLTLLAMLAAGYGAEAEEWREWLLRAIAGDPAQLQIMYGLAGERWLAERQIDWLPGFLDSCPVRVGNAASEQLQLDIFGEVLNAAYHTLVYGIGPSKFGWALIRRLLGRLEECWRDPDAGIWEVRGPNRQFTHSKVMAWVAFDRGVRMCAELGRDGPIARWAELRDEIKAQVLMHGWSERKQSFTQYYGSDALDASLLQMPIFGFIAADDPRFVSTVAAIRRELSVDGLLRRYRTEDDTDGLPPGEGVFLACSFWLVEVLAMQGKDEEARQLFERLLGLGNDVGLFSEEYDPKDGRMLGNFPQALTHLALVEAALTLDGAHPMRSVPRVTG